MFDLDKWQEIFGTIKKNKLRTILTAFSVAWGIFILIILLGAGQGLRNGVESQFANDATNYLAIEGSVTSIGYGGYKPGRQIQLTNTDFNELPNLSKGLENPSATTNSQGDKVLGYKNERAAFHVRSVTPKYNIIENAKIITGRFINNNDLNDFKKVCAIGINVKKTLFKDEEALNKYISVGATQYQVVGVFNDLGRNETDRIYIPLSTTQRLNNGKSTVGTIWATTGNSKLEQTELMAQEVRNKLAKKYNFDPKDLNALGIYNNNVEYKRIMGMLDGIKLFIYVIGALTLMAGVVGISNIMLIVVKERTKEIGVRKALGASPFSIVSLIIQESVFITAIAGYVGLMFGIGLIELIKSLGVESDFFKNPDVDLNIALWSVVAIIVSGALAGLIPAYKASKVEPIEALREN